MSSAYVGIDVNLSGYGLAILTVREIVLKFIPFVQKEKTDKAMVEWVEITRVTRDIISHKAQGDTIIVAVEDPTGMGQQPGTWMTAAILNKLTGILAAELPGRITYPSSVTWKKAICKNGKAKKDEVAAVVSLELLGVSDKNYFDGNHHISDALALAYYAGRTAGANYC